MKKSSKIVACLLAALSTFLMAGCKSCDKKKEEKGEGTYLTGSSLPDVEGTIHERYVGATSHKVLSNGQTEYKILVREDQRSVFVDAVNELQTIFREATGIQLEVEFDGGQGFDENAKYISLGETSAFLASGVIVDDAQLGPQGYQIETRGQTLFVYGQSRGVLYGVYDLMKQLVGFETYSNLITYMEKGLTEIPLPDLKIKEVPDIQYRIPVMGAEALNRVTANRMFTQMRDEVIIGEGGAHNILKYIVPMEEHIADHPDWFSGDRTQLCYTAHGNEAEYELMVAEAVKNIQLILDRAPNQHIMSITQMDVQTWCECEVCQGLEDHYGTNAASQIYFVNDVTEIVTEWLKTERNGREVEFMFFAYHKSEGSPATQQSDGSWTAVDDTVKLNDNVSVWIAPIYEDYTVSVSDPNSVNLRYMMESWKAVADSYFVWAYNVYFDNYLIPYDSYASLQDLIKYFVMFNTKFLWVQGNWNLHQNTGYDSLKGYLFAKLMWNCNLDVNTLIADYFDKVYREASDIMESTFWAWRAHSELQREMNRSGNIYSSPDEMKFWPKRYLMGQIERMEEAKKAIAKYETTDPELHQAIYDAIVCETISPRYLILELYSNTLENAELAAFKAEFKSDTNRLDFNMISEQETMEGFAD